MQQKIWTYLLDTLNDSGSAVLLLVVDSKGSSPGRKGFKMVLQLSGQMYGSIGGGIMEYKLIELSRQMLMTKDRLIVLRRQVHSKETGSERSGMICSGEQTIAIVPLYSDSIPLVEAFLEPGNHKALSLNSTRMDVLESSAVFEEGFVQNEIGWSYAESLVQKEVVHIIGGGHVGMATSRLLRRLGFYVRLYDDRKELNTFEKNDFAHEKITVDYSNLGQQKMSPQDYVVVMSFGYAGDKKIIEQLSTKKLKYIGVMGSAAKTKQVLIELEEEGVSPIFLRELNAPIGMPINSKTPEEIAVSIAAQMIAIRRG